MTIGLALSHCDWEGMCQVAKDLREEKNPCYWNQPTFGRLVLAVEATDVKYWILGVLTSRFPGVDFVTSYIVWPCRQQYLAHTYRPAEAMRGINTDRMSTIDVNFRTQSVPHTEQLLVLNILNRCQLYYSIRFGWSWFSLDKQLLQLFLSTYMYKDKSDLSFYSRENLSKHLSHTMC